ncbi:glutamate receptor U1-like [Panulirus ornatus]|uniref:glutamate receptor U1-like n=1 Tax=Panulirus ornatus TaxID=150431 RepID=UPI003A856D48
MVGVTSLLLTLTVAVILAVAQLPRPHSGKETIQVVSVAVEKVLASETRDLCALFLLTDGTTSAHSVFTEMRWLQAPGGLALFEVTAKGKRNLNMTQGHLAEMIAGARRLRQVSRCVTLVVVSDDPVFLVASAEWLLNGRLLKWSNRLLAVTSRPLHDLRHLHGTFSMMNSMVMIVDADKSYPSCKMYVYLPFSPSEDRVDWVASWSTSRGFTLSVQLPLFPEKFSMFDKTYIRLLGHRFVYRPTLLVAAEEFPPHVILDPKWIPGRPINFIGPIANVLELIAQDCNFSYVFEKPLDGSWGTKTESGSWSGMVGMVHRKEVDIGLGPFGISATRAEVVDYVWAIISDSLRIMASRGIPEVDPWSFLVPLRPLVWGIVLVALMVVLAILLLMAAYSPGKIRSHSKRAWEDLFLYVRVTLRQDMPLPVEQSWERLMLGGWMIMTIVLTRSYAGALMSMLAIKNVAQPFQYLRDVISNPAISMVWQANSVHLQYMWTVKSGVFRDVLETEKDDRLMFVTSPSYMGIVRNLVSKDRHVLVVEELTSRDLMADYFSHTGRCEFYLSKEKFLHIYFSMIGQKDHPLVPAFSKRTKIVTEAGLYNYWVRHLSANSTRCVRAPSQITVRSALSFMNIWGMFAVFAGGHAFALLLLLLERLVSDFT